MGCCMNSVQVWCYWLVQICNVVVITAKVLVYSSRVVGGVTVNTRYTPLDSSPMGRAKAILCDIIS